MIRAKHHKKSVLRSIYQKTINCGKSFCLKSTVHGLNHIALPKRHWSERLLWVGVTAIALWAALSVSLGQLQRYKDKPTVVTLEKNFRAWRFSLPAITACFENRTDPEKLVNAIKTRWNLEPGDPRYEYYARFVTIVANSDLFHLQGYEEFKDDQTLDVDLFQLAVEVTPELVVKTTSSQPLLLHWTPVMTQNGVCYTTNSVAIADIALMKLHSNITKEFPFTCQYSAMICYIIIEVAKTAHFYIHSPWDVAKTSNRPSTLYPGINRFIELSVTETRAGHGVRQLSPTRRACLYTEETTKRQVYSTEMCRLACRSRLAVELCHCRPFYYFYEAGPPCTVDGMRCLSKHGRELANFGGNKCVCSAPCLHAEFKDNFVEDQIWNSDSIPGGMTAIHCGYNHNDDVSNARIALCKCFRALTIQGDWGKGRFQERSAIRLTVQAPRSRYTREIVFHFEDLVVSFGGAAGLFLGASVISFVEIIFFALEKLVMMFSWKEAKTKQEVKQKLAYEKKIEELTIILESHDVSY